MLTLEILNYMWSMHYINIAMHQVSIFSDITDWWQIYNICAILENICLSQCHMCVMTVNGTITTCNSRISLLSSELTLIYDVINFGNIYVLSYMSYGYSNLIADFSFLCLAFLCICAFLCYIYLWKKCL